MEKVLFEDDVFIYKTNVDSDELRNKALADSLDFLSKTQYMPEDNYGYMPDWGSFEYGNDMQTKNGIDEIIKFAVLKCVELEKSNSSKFNKVNVNSWVNVVKAGIPKQSNFKNDKGPVLHNHVNLQKVAESFHPTYTFVYYAQMPNNLSNNDGTLIIGGSNDNRFYYLPVEGELVVMGGYLPHSPTPAPNSTKNRIVIAGNVGFEISKTKITLI